MSFDWQTEEDSHWDVEPTLPEPPRPKRRRWPWLTLLGVLLVGTAVFLLYRQLTQRVEVATDVVVADLVASYAVLQQAAQNKDENLFNSLLSGRDQAWSQAQRANINSGLLFDRPGFGLVWQPSLAETAVLSQTLSPELTAAELTTLQTYSLDIGNGLTQTVQLQRVDVYRLGEDRWLFAPPEREFWGVRQRLEGQLLSVRYPARDEAIVHRLAADLEAKLVQVCNTPGFVCPTEARVRLVFSPEPDSLAQIAYLGALTGEQDSADSVWEGDETIVLPTPSLVGLPQDEVGYQALFRGYAAQLLTIALNDLIGWECCENVPFYRAAIERQLFELGVAEWALADTAVFLPNDFSLQDGANLWQAPFPETGTAFAQNPAPYVVVHFLNQEMKVTPFRLMRTLALNKVGTPNEAESLQQWLVMLLGSSWTEAELKNAFRDYVSRWQASPLVLPEPEDGLVLLCHDPLRVTQGLYYFDFGLEEPLLLERLSYDELLYFTSLPGGDGLAVVARESSESEPETYLLRNGQARIDVNWANVEGIVSRPPLAIPTITDPNGRYLLWTIAPGYAAGTFYALTDLAACQPGDSCAAIQIGGYPVWSPTSEQLVTLTTTNPWWGEQFSNGLMLLRDAPTAEAINSPGFGSSLFWLDDEQFGYLLQFQNGRQQLVLADGDLSQPEIVIDNESLRALFPERERPASLRIQSAQPLPGNPTVYFILAYTSLGDDASAYMLLYDRSQGVITLLTPLGQAIASEGNGQRLSPDGRFLQLTLAEEEGDGVRLYLQDTRAPQIFAYQLLGETPFPRHFYASWSPDGEWLAMPELGYVRLWHNGEAEQLLSFENLNCTNAAWVAKLEP